MVHNYSAWVAGYFLVLLFLTGFGLFDLWKNFEVNRCAMSYIPLEPIFEPVSTPESGDYPPLPTYSLLKYCSGRCLPVKGSDGFPILYVPGTRGSFKTVRSIASSQEYFNMDTMKFPFDFFMIDFNEELSSLSGDIVNRQSEFVRYSIRKVLELYQNTSNPPQSLLLIGHSMGTVAILNLLADPTFDFRLVNTVISLAGPILSPVFSPGPVMDAIYDRVGNFMELLANNSSQPLVLLTFTGGSRDLLVPDALGNPALKDPRLANNTLWLSTSSISHAWASCDHLCILWCRQVIHEIYFTLEELHQHSTHPNYLDPKTRIRLLQSRFITPPLILSTNEDQTAVSKLEPISASKIGSTTSWTDLTGREFLHQKQALPDIGAFIKLGPFLTPDRPKENILIMLRYFSEAPYFRSEIRTAWLYFCPSNSSLDKVNIRLACTHLYPISSLPSVSTTFLPSSDFSHPYKVALIRPNLDINGGHLVLHLGAIPYVESEFIVSLESIKSMSERESAFPTPPIPIPFFESTIPLLLHRTKSFRKDRFNSVYHRFSLTPDKFILSPSTPVPRLIVSTKQCATKQSENGIVSWHLTTNNYHYTEQLRPNQITTVDLEVPDWTFNQQPNSTALLDLYLNPFCDYEISVHYSITAWIGKLYRLHWPHLFGFLCLHVLVRIAHTLYMNKSSEVWITGVNGKQANVPVKSMKQSTEHHSLWPGGLSWHLLVSLLQCLSFHLCDFITSDWTQLYNYGHVGARLVSVPSVPGLSLSNWLLALSPFAVLAFTMSTLIPCILDIMVFGSHLLTAGLARLLALLLSVRESSPPESTANRWVIISIGMFGLLVSETASVLLYALYIAFNLFRTELLHFCSQRRQSTGTSSAKQVTLDALNVRLHQLAAICFVLLSLLQVENWMALLHHVESILFTGALPLGNLTFSGDSLSVLLASLLTAYLYSPSFSLTTKLPPLDEVKHANFARLLSLSGASACMFALMHIAFKAHHAFLLCIVGLSLLLVAADSHEQFFRAY